jgi:hypothetical protein
VVTVNPSPKVVFREATKLYVQEDSSPITIASPTTGTVTFNWTANVPAGISEQLGNEYNSTQTLVNLTTNPLTVIIRRQPLSKIMGFLVQGRL